MVIMIERSASYPGPHTSQEMLFDFINLKQRGLKLKRIERFIEKGHLRFYGSLMSTLIEGMQEGRIVFEDASGKFKPGLPTSQLHSN